MNRRRFLRTAFCSSAALGLACERRALAAGEAALAPSVPGLDFLVLGDFGSAEPPQTAVAMGMRNYAAAQQLTPHGLFLLGDNFYGKLNSGVNSSRWAKGFSEMYPKASFPGPAWAILGNHDYHDTPDGEKIQLERALRPGTRWTMPSKWYRLDFAAAPHPLGGNPATLTPAPNRPPLLTVLCLDTNTRALSSKPEKKEDPEKVKPSLTEAEETAQAAWFTAELAKPRAPWTIVLGHHPIFSNGDHGDSPSLITWLDPLLRQHKIPLYLCGHDHDLQHLELAGHPTSFVISGGGGARVRPLKREDRGPYNGGIYGFSHLQVTPETLTLRHLDPNTAQVHAFSRTRDGKVAIG